MADVGDRARRRPQLHVSRSLWRRVGLPPADYGMDDANAVLIVVPAVLMPGLLRRRIFGVYCFASSVRQSASDSRVTEAGGCCE